MKLCKEPKTKETVYLELSKHSCDFYITAGEVMMALMHSDKPELKEEFTTKLLETKDKTLGEFLELCSEYVDLQIV